MKKQKLVVLAKVELVIPGEPRPKRTGQAGLYKKGTKTFPTIKKHPLNEKAEEAIQTAFFSHWASLPENDILRKLLAECPWEGPFAYQHEYWFKMTKEEERKYKNLDVIYHTRKPDSDNLNKMSNDALEGFIFKNDSQGQALKTPKYAWRGEEKSILRFLLLK